MICFGLTENRVFLIASLPGETILNNEKHIPVHVFYCDFNANENINMGYIFSYYDLKEPESYDLEYEVEVSTRSSETKLLENKKVNYENLVGKEVKSMSEDALIKARFFQVGNRIYKLQVGTLPSRGENKEMYDFLNSFEIIE